MHAPHASAHASACGSTIGLPRYRERGARQGRALERHLPCEIHERSSVALSWISAERRVRR